MPVRTTKHKVSKQCWQSPTCRKQFVDQYENLGQKFLYIKAIASNPTAQWAVFELPS